MDSSDSDVTKPPPAGASRDVINAWFKAWMDRHTTRGSVPAMVLGDFVDPAPEARARRAEFVEQQREADECHKAVLRFRAECLRSRLRTRRMARATRLREINNRPSGEKVQPRQRQRQARSRRARSPGRLGSEDPEPEPPRLCAGCGEELEGRRKDARTHNAACRQRASRSARADTDRWLADALAIEEKALALVRAGEMTGFDALALVLWPTDRIRDALEEVAA